jgi:heme-degrading monooxygenase HmoA
LKSTYTLLLVLSISAAQSALAQRGPVARPDVYHVHFAKAVPGKASQLGDNLKTQAPNAPMKGHLLVLRHQDGEDWDYAVIEHLGIKATVDAATPPPPPAVRDLGEWHTDTFVNGPAWAVFARAMGIDQAASRTTGSVYVVSVYRVVPGHRDQLEKVLAEPPGAGDKTAGTVLMQHLEGGPWQYLTVTRYNSWQDFGISESNRVAETSKGSGGWFQVREHAAFHNDTLTNRIAP